MNWCKLLQELFDSGMTQQRVASELKKSQAWVSDTAKGRYSDLRWADGQALIALHERICRKAA